MTQNIVAVPQLPPTHAERLLIEASQFGPEQNERVLIKARMKPAGCLSFFVRQLAKEPNARTYGRQRSWMWTPPQLETPKLPPPPPARPVRVYNNGLLRAATTETLASVPYLVNRLDRPCVVFDIDDTLVRKGTNETCESTTASVVNQLQEKGVPVFFLTARHPKALKYSLKQLRRAHIDPSRTVPWADGLNLQAQELNLPYVGKCMVKPEGESGVVCVGGTKKGGPLQEMVKQYNLRSVMMVDDSEAPLSSVSEVAQACQIPVMCVLYTGAWQGEKKAQGSNVFARFRETLFSADNKRAAQAHPKQPSL